MILNTVWERPLAHPIPVLRAEPHAGNGRTARGLLFVRSMAASTAGEDKKSRIAGILTQPARFTHLDTPRLNSYSRVCGTSPARKKMHNAILKFMLTASLTALLVTGCQPGPGPQTTPGPAVRAPAPEAKVETPPAPEPASRKALAEGSGSWSAPA